MTARSIHTQATLFAFFIASLILFSSYALAQAIPAEADTVTGASMT